MWTIERTKDGGTVLMVSYSSACDWTARISAALAGAGLRREQCAAIIAEPESTARRRQLYMKF